MFAVVVTALIIFAILDIAMIGYVIYKEQKWDKED